MRPPARSSVADAGPYGDAPRPVSSWKAFDGLRLPFDVTGRRGVIHRRIAGELSPTGARRRRRRRQVRMGAGSQISPKVLGPIDSDRG